MATPPAPDALADSVLTARYRDGYDDAAAVLFARHHPAALRVARALVPEVRAEDLASEAFTTVLDALRRGEGPSEAFRPYLVTTVRELHPDLHADLRHDGAAVPPADPEQHVEAAVLARAFASLPERWQVALWHTCLQDESDESVSTLLGLDGPAVAALAHRARAGLRRAYVGEHRAVVHGQDCTRARELLPAYVERRTRSDRQLEGHLEQCRDCGGIYLGLRNLRADLGTVLAPALLGGAAGALHAAGTSDPDEPLLVASEAGPPPTVPAGPPPAVAGVTGATRGTGGGGPPGWLVPAASAAAVVVVIGMVLGIVAVTNGRAPATDREPTSPVPAAPSATPSASAPAAGPTSADASPRRKKRRARPAQDPTTADEPSTTPALPGTPAAPGPTSATTPPGATPGSTPGTPPAVSPTPRPSTGPSGGPPVRPTPSPTRTPTRSPSDGPTTPGPTAPSPTPTPTPTPTPIDPDPSPDPDPGGTGPSDPGDA